MDKCFHCLKDIPPNTCCQPFEVGGNLRLFHIGCLEPWYDEEIPILRVRHGKESFVTQDPYRPEPGEEVTLEWENMKQGKYYSLKEFKGF